MFGLFASNTKKVSGEWMPRDLQELEDEFDETVKLYDSILPAIKAMHQSQMTNIKKLSEFSEAMHTHGSQEKHPLSKVFEKCAVAHKGLMTVQTEYLNKYKSLVVDPVTQFIEVDIKKMKTQRKNYRSEIEKLERREAALKKLESSPQEKPEKITSAKNDVATQEEKCKTLLNELRQSYEELLRKKRVELTTMMRELGMMQLENLDSQQRVLEQPHKDIESLSALVLTSINSRKSTNSNTHGSAANNTVGINQTKSGGAGNSGEPSNPFLDDEDLTPRDE